MAVSVITNGLIELQYGSAGGYSNNALITNLPSGMQAGDFIVIHVGGEGGNPRSSTAATDPFKVTMNLTGGSTASASCIAVDYGHRDNNDNIQVSVWGYVVTSSVPQSILIEYTEKTIVGGAVLRGVDTDNFTTWRDTTGDRTIEDAAAESDNTYQTNTNANTRVTDFSMNTGIIKGGWNTTNYGTEAALYMAMSHRLHIMGYALVPNTPASDSANWEKSLFQANPPQFSSGLAIRPDSAPGTTYAITWDSQSGVTNTQRKAIVAIAIPASTSTGTLVEPICEATAVGESSATFSRTVPLFGSATGASSASSTASRTAPLQGAASSSASTSAIPSRTVNPQASTTGTLEVTATTSATRTLQAEATGIAESSGTATRSTTTAGQSTGTLESSAQPSRATSTSATATGTSGASAQLTTGITLNGQTTGSLESSGVPARTASLTAEATGESETSAVGTRSTQVSGAATGSSAASTLTTTDDELAGIATGSMESSASLSRTAPVNALGQSLGTASAQVSRTASIQAQASGNAEASTEFTVEGAVDILGNALGSLEALAVPGRTAPVQGAAGTSSQAIAEVQRSANVLGEALGSLEVQASITKDREIAGAVTLEVSTQAGLSVTRNVHASVDLIASTEASPEVTLGIRGAATGQSATTATANISITVHSNGEADATAKVTLDVSQAEPFLKAGAKKLVSLEVLTEAITYYPGGDLSAGKSIRAVVQREEPEVMAIALEAGALTVQVELWIATDSTVGISTIREGKDLADVVVTEGKAAERVRIVEVLDQDPGMVHVLGVR